MNGGSLSGGGNSLTAVAGGSEGAGAERARHAAGRRRGARVSLPKGAVWRWRLFALIGASAMTLAASLAIASAPAGAAVPKETDIMFIFDTSGSMEGVLEEAKEQIKTLVANTRASLPDVEFGIANVEDIPGYNNGKLEPVENQKGETVAQLTEKEYEEDSEKPWRLDQPLTTNEAQVEAAIENLSGSEVAHYGGDAPEAYGRALWETATNPLVGWRAGARHEIVLIGDQVPHDANLNEGIPAELQFTQLFTDGFETWPNTGEELPGGWGIPDTQWKAGESLEFHQTLQRLDTEQKPLAMVNYFHTDESEEDNFIHYWEYWAADTGGQAIVANEGEKTLDTKLAAVIIESAEGVPPCPPGYERSPTTPCVKKPAPAPAPAPVVVPPPPTSAPIPKVVIVDEEDGEIEDEVEFPEGGEADLAGEVDDGAEAARFQGWQSAPLSVQFGQQPVATIARRHGKSKKCRKGFVKKGGRCVSNAPIPYGQIKVTIAGAGKYKLKLKPSAAALAALRKGKHLNVKLTLEFTPAGTTTHILSTKFVQVRIKKHKHKHKGHGHKK